MQVNHFIDHTLLKAQATQEQIRVLCREARDYQFAAVCVNSIHVPLASQELKGSKVKVCTVVGFPLGASPSAVKCLEADIAIENGASEIDMVINIGALIQGDTAKVQEDIIQVAQTCHAKQAILKVILETCLLTDEQIRQACKICMQAQADFVKSSTGFSNSGATFDVIKLMKETVGNQLEVKASGGVKTPDDAKKMIELGATRIGTSSGVKLVTTESIH